MKNKLHLKKAFPVLMILFVIAFYFVSCGDGDSIDEDIIDDKDEFVLPPIMYPAIYNAITQEAKLTWDPVPNADGYKVYYTENVNSNADYLPLSQEPYRETSAIDSSIPVGVTRIYVVKAFIGKSESKFSEPVILAINNTGVDLIDGIWADMVDVEGGTFIMGKGSNRSDSKPYHEVTLSSFRMMKFEMTQEIFEALGYANPSKEPTGAKMPVNQVRWVLARDFINKLNGVTNMNYRLPTEAEWEYAARGGNKDTDGDFPGFNNPELIDDYVVRGDHNHPTEVGTKMPNELGLYDMAGNVAEWCSDFFDKQYYTTDAVTNPKGPKEPTNTDSIRIARGGGVNHYRSDQEVFLMVHTRAGEKQQVSHHARGFRLVHSIKK